MNTKVGILLLLLGSSWAFFPNAVFAVGSSGFENASYSAKTLGQGNAVVARPQDPSTVLFNPAGLVDLSEIQVAAGLQGLDFRSFHKSSNTGDKSHSDFRLIMLPSFYVSVNPGELLDDRFALGFGMNSPFGLSSAWNSIGVARTGGYRNALKTVATTLAGAVKITDWFRIGAGAINYWIYDYGQSFNYPNSFVLGVAAADGMVRTETSGYGWGWNMGTLIEPHPQHKLGVSFRSKSDVRVNGRALIEGLVSGIAQGYDTAPDWQSAARSDIQLPANVTFGYAYEPSEKWAAEFDMGLTFWGAFKDQDFDFDRPNVTVRALGRIPRDYETSLSFNLGGHYKIREDIDLLAGFFFYEAAAPKNHVDNFLPDANRYGWTIGTSYKVTDRATIDFMYLFMLFGRRHFSNPEQLARTGANIDGVFTSILHGAMVTFTYRFDFPSPNRAAVEKSLPKAK